MQTQNELWFIIIVCSPLVIRNTQREDKIETAAHLGVMLSKSRCSIIPQGSVVARGFPRESPIMTMFRAILLLLAEQALKNG
jgi:hypothetical protein